MSLIEGIDTSRVGTGRGDEGENDSLSAYERKISMRPDPSGLLPFASFISTCTHLVLHILLTQGFGFSPASLVIPAMPCIKGYKVDLDKITRLFGTREDDPHNHKIIILSSD